MDTILMRHINGQLRSWAKNYFLLTIMVVQAIITPTLYLTKIFMPLKNFIRRESIILLYYWAPDMLFFAEEFLVWRGWKRKIPEFAQSILVSLGGSDPENVTRKVYDAILQLELNRLNVIIIVANNRYSDQMKCLNEKSKVNIELRSNVEKMSDLMAWADVAVSAGGTSTWELAFMGLPMITIAIADNQCQIVEELSNVRAAVNVGWHKDITPSMIADNISKLLCDPKKGVKCRNGLKLLWMEMVLIEFLRN